MDDPAVDVRAEIESSRPLDPIGEARTRNPREGGPRRLGDNAGAVVETRHGAHRRLRAVGDPAVEVHQHRAQERCVVHDVERVPPARAGIGVGVRRGQGAGSVLAAREEIEPRLGMRRDVSGALHVRVNERGVAPPVLGRRVDRDDLRHGAARLEAGQLRAALTGHPIDRRGVGEREQAPDGGGRVQRRLAEALVELAAPGARDVRDHPVEDLPGGLVLVQAEIEQVTQEPAGLRHPDDVGVVELAGTRVAGGRRARAKPRGGIAYREEPEADERRILGPVDQLVDLPGLESAGERDVRRVGEPPRRPRDRHRRRAGVLADGEPRRRIAEVGRRLGDVIAVGHRQGVDTGVRSPFAEHRTADQSVLAPRHRHRERQQTVLARHVVLPAAPGHRVPVPHQEPITEVLRGRRVGYADRAVEHPERDLPTAVGNVEQESPLAARGIDGPQ